MSSFLTMFNGVNLAEIGSGLNVTSVFRPDGIDAPADLAEQDVPRRQGSVVQAARKKSRLLRFVGQVGGSACTADGLQSALDALRQATAPESGPQALYAGRDDRFWMAQRETYTESFDEGMMYGRLADVQIAFRAADPDAYASTGLGGDPALTLVTETVTLATSGTTVVAPAGDSTAHPLWSLTMNAGTGTLTLTNAATGETAAISGTFTSGQVVTLDAREGSYGAYLGGVVNYGLFTGPIPRLWPVSNAITIAGSGLSVSSASLSYSPRWG